MDGFGFGLSVCGERQVLAEMDHDGNGEIGLNEFMAWYVALCDADASLRTMRAELIDHFEPCMTEIYLHVDARMADYIRTHPYY